MMPVTITAELLYAIAGHKSIAQAEIIPAIAPVITALAPVADLDTQRIIHFLGQCCEESDGFATLHEYASGAAYEGRSDLGNTEPGDGVRFKGRGMIETTGRANYRALTKWYRTGPFPDAPDFEAEPEKLEEPRWAVVSALAFWVMHGLNRYADKNDIRGLTKAINGGLNGLRTRIIYTDRARIALTGPRAPEKLVAAVLKRGMSGGAVWLMQSDLKRAAVKITVDGDFGPATEKAVKAFQTKHGLVPDGEVGPLTRRAIQASIQGK